MKGWSGAEELASSLCSQNCTQPKEIDKKGKDAVGKIRVMGELHKSCQLKGA
jgi:hypothetical protein